jgi:uncharacterized PurR-regulated membrane protein YhhQ (DUF165 family)
MNASRMLAQHLDTNVLFTSVMTKAKELMEASRSIALTQTQTVTVTATVTVTVTVTLTLTTVPNPHH